MYNMSDTLIVFRESKIEITALVHAHQWSECVVTEHIFEIQIMFKILQSNSITSTLLSDIIVSIINMLWVF